MHPVDLIRKKRDGQTLTAAEIEFLVAGAASETIPPEQLAAWLMTVFFRGLSHPELDALTRAMRFSGRVLDHSALGRPTVDKHSTGGVGDKTSLIIAPIAAAAGVAVPMISGRALGHTGGTLDKLESIPGFRTGLSTAEADAVLRQCGVAMMAQTADLVPADRVLYALRDRTATVECPPLICASIMSKKLAAGLNALVLDVKTGSGAFLRNEEEARSLARLMVETGQQAGTRTVALLTDMGQPLGRFAGNWVEVQESLEVLADHRHPLSEDLRELSLILAGWMIFLGGNAENPGHGKILAEEKLADGSALRVFREMVAAQGGDTAVLDASRRFHTPKHRRDFLAPRAGYLARMDCTAVGWAVQRLGAGRESAGDPVQAHAGIEMHAKIGSRVQAGQPLCTLFAEDESRFAEPERLLTQALVFADHPPAPLPLVRELVTSAATK